MDKKKAIDAIKKILEEGAGKKKFTQSAELMINTRSIDFSKSENRLNLDIALPKGRGEKRQKVAIIAEEATTSEAKKHGIDLVILPNEIQSYATPAKLKELAKNYIILVQPNLMAQSAKSLGQYLGARGKIPRPIIGDLKEMIEKTRRSVRVVTKGKFLPVVQAFIGTEKMAPEELFENFESVYDVVKNKVNEGNIKSIYVKLSMGKPVKIQ
ncbi:MAG: 50S ribosomal protein L1 [Candidatus Micrarchaeota archaeon]